MDIQSIIFKKVKIMLRFKYIWVVLLLAVLASCEEGKYDAEIVPPIEVVSGEADFSNFVAVGNSLTAGFADGALFKASQANAFPNLLAEKMALAGGGEITTPWMNDNTGGLLLGGEQIQGPRLYFDGAGLSVLPGPPTTEVSNIQPGPYNNMGVPGAKSFHLLANGYGDISNLALGLANPYFVRMASNPNASILEDAMAVSPTFFTLWIGANDVLGYAMSGGDGSDPITDKPVFDGSMAALIGTMTSGGAKGVVGNIPNVLTAAYFTTVPFAPLDPTNPEFAEQIPLLNEAYGLLNQAFTALGVPERSVVFSTTAASPIVVYDESLPSVSAGLFTILTTVGGVDPGTAFVLSQQYGQSRPANENDLLTLPSQNVIATVNTEYFQQLVGMGVPPETAGQLSVNGLTYPMPDTYVLVPSEQEEVSEATLMFNETIAQLTSNAGLAEWDAYAFSNRIATIGYSSDGFNFNGSLIFGGVFSLDGLHFTGRANAVIANEIMKLIDATYGSNFEEAGVLFDVGDYPVIYSPALM